MGKAGLPVSPLAPARFPDLPVIEGVEFASGAAGVKYQGRTDVTLIRVAPGSTLAGAFTRSSTRAACILDNQAKLAGGGDAPQGAGIATVSRRGITDVIFSRPAPLHAGRTCSCAIPRRTAP